MSSPDSHKNKLLRWCRRPWRRWAAESLIFFLLLSAAVHGVTLFVATRQAAPPGPSAAESAAEPQAAAEQSAVEPALLQQQRRELANEAVTHQLKRGFESQAQDLAPEEAEQLWDEVAPQLDEQVRSLTSMFNDEAFDPVQIDEAWRELQADMMSLAADEMRRMLVDQLLDLVTRQVEQRTAASLADDLSSRLEGRVGSQVEQQLSASARGDQRRRDRDMQKALSTAAGALRRTAQEQKQLAETTAEREADDEGVDDGAAAQQDRIAERTDAAFASLDRAAETVQSLNPLAADRMQAHVPAASRQAAAAAQSAAQQSLADGTPASESMSTAAERLEQLADGAEAAAQEIADAKGLDELALEVMANLTAGDLRDHIEAHFQETFADEVAPRAANAVADQAETMMERLDIAVDDALAAELRRRVIEALLGHVPEAMETPAGELANEQARSDHDLDEAASSEGADDARQRAAAAMMSRASQAAERVMGQQMQAAANRASLGDVSEINQAVQPGEAFASTMDQLAAAMREGRGNGGSLAGMMGLMAMADGQGSGATPAGPSNPFAERLGNVGGSRDMAALRRMMEMIDRRDDPDALYDEVVREAEAMVSRPATPWPSQRSATILLAPHSAESPPADEPDESQRARVVPEPSFEPINYGAAPMAHQPVRVDGELDDWDLDRALVMHVVKGEEIDSEQGLPFHVMWSNEAFYITMDIPNEQVEIPEGRRTFWVGDCIEVWIDTSNRRGPQMYTPAHQIFFLPWATQDNPELRTGESRASSNDNRYALAVKDIPAGYRVEMAIPHEALRGPRLEAGRHIGFQIAVNHSHGGDGIEWVQRGNSSFNTPAMWGDLLLLGSDAEISFSRDEKGDKSLDAIVPGEPVYVRVSDPDMSLSAEYPDQLTVIARQSDGAAMLLVLGETAPTSGVFVGGLDTRSIFAGGDEDENVLAVAPGEPIIVGYLDQRRDYGESNEQITAELKVGFPRMRIVRD